jgi:hypothetical protein
LYDTIQLHPSRGRYAPFQFIVIMIEDNSGKFFRFKLDFDLGYSFAEVYDFTDIHSADGTKVFIYNRIDSAISKSYNLSEITSSGIGLGPITLHRYPNNRGIGAWKYLFKSNNYIIEDPPITKECQELAPWTYDWNLLKKWHKSDWNYKSKPVYLLYPQVRSLETRIMNSNIGVVKKVTMKYLIDNNKNVGEYYSFREIGNINMFIQLINTYYGLEKCQQLIKGVPSTK